MRINLDKITIDPSLQIRVETNSPTVSEYEERMREGENFPPLLVWKTDGEYILLDGWHRHAAMVNNGFTDCEVKAFTGSKTEALIAAAISNRTHGLPMTRADKRKAIQRLVESSGELSSRMIGEAIGVSNHTVDAIRNELGNCPISVKRKGGGTYPAKRMKCEPRTDDEESDRDDENSEPPPDPGMGGKSLSPEELSKTERKRGKGVELANDAIAILQRIPIDDPLREIGLDTVTGWIKANK